MKKASTLKVSAQLRKLTELNTVRQNDTRWSSTYQMTEQFFRIRAELSAISDSLPCLLPTHVECDIMRKGFVHLEQFHQVTVMLQKEGITLLEVRDLFEEVMEDYPELGGHLSKDSKIVVNPVFEQAVLKLSKNLVLWNSKVYHAYCCPMCMMLMTTMLLISHYLMLVVARQEMVVQLCCSRNLRMHRSSNLV